MALAPMAIIDMSKYPIFGELLFSAARWTGR
jgi:hypothetical protein